MKIIIHPYKGIEIEGKGLIEFGMTRDKIQSFFDEKPEKRLLGKEENISKDMYYDNSLHFTYEFSGLLKSIEITEPLNPFFQDQELLKTSYSQIESWFKTQDKNLEIEDGEGLTSHKFGIGLWSPDYEEGDLEYIAESVFLFKKDYYSK